MLAKLICTRAVKTIDPGFSQEVVRMEECDKL